MVILDVGDQDVLVARITTQEHTTHFDVAIQEWTPAHLLSASTVRIHKLAMIGKTLIRRSLRLAPADWANVQVRLKSMLGESEVR
jgi:mRNA interferase MazF